MALKDTEDTQPAGGSVPSSSLVREINESRERVFVKTHFRCGSRGRCGRSESLVRIKQPESEHCDVRESNRTRETTDDDYYSDQHSSPAREFLRVRTMWFVAQMANQPSRINSQEE